MLKNRLSRQIICLRRGQFRRKKPLWRKFVALRWKFYDPCAYCVDRLLPPEEFFSPAGDSSPGLQLTSFVFWWETAFSPVAAFEQNNFKIKSWNSSDDTCEMPGRISIKELCSLLNVMWQWLEGMYEDYEMGGMKTENRWPKKEKWHEQNYLANGWVFGRKYRTTKEKGWNMNVHSDRQTHRETDRRKERKKESGYFRHDYLLQASTKWIQR